MVDTPWAKMLSIGHYDILTRSSGSSLQVQIAHRLKDHAHFYEVGSWRRNRPAD